MADCDEKSRYDGLVGLRRATHSLGAECLYFEDILAIEEPIVL